MNTTQTETPRLAATDTRVTGGAYVVGRDKKGRAICHIDHVTAAVLRAAFMEAKALGLKTPITVMGRTSEVGETQTFRFVQVS